MTMGNRIKSVRRKAGMTQREFSKSICVTQPFLSMVEHNKVKPSRSVIRLMCILFDVKEDWIIKGNK